MDGKSLLRAAVIAAVLLVSTPSAWAQVTNYVVGAQDVLTIGLFDQPELGGKYTVEADGSFTFPLIGRVTAGGLTLRDIENELRKRLSDGFFRNPQVSVAVEMYRSQRVFVVGEVRSPGTYPLNGDMTLIEVLSRAGSVTSEAGGEALIVRARGGKTAQGPILPTSPDLKNEETEVLRVDVKELQSGRLSQNAQLRDGDTIFVPRAELVYVSGQVRNPGSFPLQRGMTVRQAVSLAGGLSDRGSERRIRIDRLVDGKRREASAKMDDVVQAGDTIIVKESFF
jgi:polysaccharide biosynthesis/export protein